jgi:hypothetical protein
MEKAGGFDAVKMPPVHAAVTYLLAVYIDLGPCHSNGFGMVKHSYSEIALAAPWADERERRAIRDMSGAYIDGVRLGEDPFGIAPYSG